MAVQEVAAGTLKLVSAYSPNRPLRDVVESTLRAHIDEHDVRYLFGRMFVVNTDASPDTIRDWLREVLADNESAFVVEFERWSGLGEAIDSEWLLRRGH